MPTTIRQAQQLQQRIDLPLAVLPQQQRQESDERQPARHGDPARGRTIATDGNRGNCVACHVMPLDDVEGYGTIGPTLAGIGGRYPEGYIRLRVVDTKSFNPASIMPGYYRDPAKIHRPAKMLQGRTFLTAQQVEDVIAFLVTMK